MKDKLIDLETAILAKEKGFRPEDDWNPTYVAGYIEDILTEIQEEDWSREDYYLTPTQSLLAKWLREVHKLSVLSYRKLLGEIEDDKPFYYNNIWVYSIDDLLITTEGIAQMRGFNLSDTVTFYTYEQALEIGLQEALKLIKI